MPCNYYVDSTTGLMISSEAEFGGGWHQNCDSGDKIRKLKCIYYDQTEINECKIKKKTFYQNLSL